MGLGMGMGGLGESLFGLVSVMRLRWVEEVLCWFKCYDFQGWCWWKWESRLCRFCWRMQSVMPTVITFPVVHNKPTWCYPLNTQSDFGTCRRDIQTTYPIDDVNKMRNLHELFQAVVLNGNSLWYRRDDRLVVLELRIFGLGGPYHRFQIALLPSLIMPLFSDLSSSHLLMLMLARNSYISSNSLSFKSRFSIRCIGLHFNRPLREKMVPFFCNVLLMFLLYLKTLDGVALCLLY